MKCNLISLLFCFVVLTTTSQTTNKKYINTNGNFSVELPNNWSVLNDTRIENRIAVCVPTLDKELKEFANCFEGTIFYIEKYKTDLATTLKSKGFVVSNDSVFIIDKKNKKIEVSKIQKNNYKGIYNQISCSFFCKDSDKANQGKCDYLFFSLNAKTICIYTNGKPLPDFIRKNIIATFKFI
ncbi:MAG: hypothetical protein SFY56_11380 [Bacteroidota bacterium]|nr:hypothetical protein [Bacteroidota bacterium]